MRPPIRMQEMPPSFAAEDSRPPSCPIARLTQGARSRPLESLCLDTRGLPTGPGAAGTTLRKDSREKDDLLYQWHSPTDEIRLQCSCQVAHSLVLAVTPA